MTLGCPAHELPLLLDLAAPELMIAWYEHRGFAARQPGHDPHGQVAVAFVNIAGGDQHIETRARWIERLRVRYGFEVQVRQKPKADHGPHSPAAMPRPGVVLALK